MALKVVNIARPLQDSSAFERAGLEYVERTATTTEEVIEALRDADGALIGIIPDTDRQVLEVCSMLKVVSRSGVGVDSVDIDAATELGVCVCNTPGTNTSEVADHAMALLLSLNRLVGENDAAVKAGAWSDNPALIGGIRPRLRRIAGHTVGIVGLGNIGRAFATRVRGFGPERIIAHDPYVPQTTGDLYGVQMVEFDELLSESDYITIHAPSTDETHYMFDQRALERMKPTAVLINCARGPIINPVALHAGLRDGEIAAAGLDVTEIEPIDAEDPLLSLDNILLTPHVAGGSPTSGREGARKQAENVILILSGEKPHGLANPEVIKSIAVMRATNPGRWAGVSDFSTALAV